MTQSGHRTPPFPALLCPSTMAGRAPMGARAGGEHEATGISQYFDRCGGYVSARGACTASRSYAAHWHYRSCKFHRYEISEPGAGLRAGTQEIWLDDWPKRSDRDALGDGQ